MSAELTAGEKAYLESGGLDAAALMEENKAAEPVVAEVKAEEPVAEKKEEPVVAAAEESEPGEEEIPASEGKPKRRMVDSRALKAERTKNKELQEELAKFRDNYNRVDERLKMLGEAMTEPAKEDAQEEPAEIDVDQDVFGALKQTREELRALRSQFGEQRAETAEERQTRATVDTFRRDAASFAAKTPDFTDAYNHLIGLRKSQLEMLGYSEQEVTQFLYQEELGLVQRALGQKKSPAEAIYKLSESMGYRKAAPVAKAAEPAPAAPKAPSVTEEIDRIKAAPSKSLSSGGGAAGEELSLEWLANASPKEFAAFMDKPGNRERVEIAMGRRVAA